MSEIVLEATESKPKYDPTKPYTWAEDAEFSFKGAEFGFLFNLLVREEEKLSKELTAINLMKDKLKGAVESGVAIEKTK